MEKVKMTFRGLAKRDSFTFYRLDPSSPGRFHISEDPAYRKYDKDYSQRYQFWSQVFKKIPPFIHHKESVTWKDPKIKHLAASDRDEL